MLSVRTVHSITKSILYIIHEWTLTSHHKHKSIIMITCNNSIFNHFIWGREASRMQIQIVNEYFQAKLETFMLLRLISEDSVPISSFLTTQSVPFFSCFCCFYRYCFLEDSNKWNYYELCDSNSHEIVNSCTIEQYKNENESIHHVQWW